jgi:hypothetical protein
MIQELDNFETSFAIKDSIKICLDALDLETKEKMKQNIKNHGKRHREKKHTNNKQEIGSHTQTPQPIRATKKNNKNEQLHQNKFTRLSTRIQMMNFTP